MGEFIVRGRARMALVSCALLSACGEGGGGGTGVDREALVDPLLPDLVVRESDLGRNSVSRDDPEGKIVLRIAGGMANVGEGKLELLASDDPPSDDRRTLVQRIHGKDGRYADVVAGELAHNDAHAHFHVENWASYRLREHLPGGGVGEVLASRDKVSFCVFDLTVHDSTLPGFPREREFAGCGAARQGLSVGWADVYGASLPGQSIDLSGVAPGRYWLEAEVSPDRRFEELDTENNVSRVLVDLTPEDLEGSEPGLPVAGAAP